MVNFIESLIPFSSTDLLFIEYLCMAVLLVISVSLVYGLIISIISGFFRR